MILRATALFLSLGLAPALAEPISEVTGNWAGEAGNGFSFRAVLSDRDGKARLEIWNGMDGDIPDGPAQLDVTGIVWRGNLIEAGEQRLEVSEGPDATLLQIVTETSDEEYRSREALAVQYIDNQFTVVGYYAASSDINTGGDAFECDVDVWKDEVVVNGARRDVPALDFEAKNASQWTETSAVDMGYCPLPEQAGAGE
jgi:hypothetical protein